MRRRRRDPVVHTHVHDERLVERAWAEIARRYLRTVSERHASERGQRMAVYANDFVGRSILVDGRFERVALDTIMGFVTSQASFDRGTVAIDVGANVGNHAIYFASHFAHVWAFEANPFTAELLRFNARFSDRIQTFPFGLGAQDEVRQMDECDLNFARSKVRTGEPDTPHGTAMLPAQGATGPLAVTLRTLDGVDGLPARVGLIKIDVEGMEGEVLEGADVTLRRDRPVVLFELMTEAFAGGGVPSSVARLRDLGYRFAYLDEVDGQRSLLGKIVRRWSSVARGRWIRRIELVPCTVPPARSHQLVVAVP